MLEIKLELSTEGQKEQNSATWCLSRSTAPYMELCQFL